MVTALQSLGTIKVQLSTGGVGGFDPKIAVKPNLDLYTSDLSGSHGSQPGFVHPAILVSKDDLAGRAARLGVGAPFLQEKKTSQSNGENPNVATVQCAAFGSSANAKRQKVLSEDQRQLYMNFFLDCFSSEDPEFFNFIRTCTGLNRNSLKSLDIVDYKTVLQNGTGFFTFLLGQQDVTLILRTIFFLRIVRHTRNDIKPYFFDKELARLKLNNIEGLSGSNPIPWNEVEKLVARILDVKHAKIEKMIKDIEPILTYNDFNLDKLNQKQKQIYFSYVLLEIYWCKRDDFSINFTKFLKTFKKYLTYLKLFHEDEVDDIIDDIDKMESQLSTVELRPQGNCENPDEKILLNFNRKFFYEIMMSFEGYRPLLSYIKDNVLRQTLVYSAYTKSFDEIANEVLEHFEIDYSAAARFLMSLDKADAKVDEAKLRAIQDAREELEPYL